MSGEPTALLALLSNRQAHDNATAAVTLKELRALRLLIEAEARQQERDAIRAAWTDAKLRKGSVMHDVGGMIAVVDAILDTQDKP